LRFDFEKAQVKRTVKQRTILKTELSLFCES